MIGRMELGMNKVVIGNKDELWGIEIKKVLKKLIKEGNDRLIMMWD
jgi:hypothetical protein